MHGSSQSLLPGIASNLDTQVVLNINGHSCSTPQPNCERHMSSSHRGKRCQRRSMHGMHKVCTQAENVGKLALLCLMQNNLINYIRIHPSTMYLPSNKQQRKQPAQHRRDKHNNMTTVLWAQLSSSPKAIGFKLFLTVTIYNVQSIKQLLDGTTLHVQASMLQEQQIWESISAF